MPGIMTAYHTLTFCNTELRFTVKYTDVHLISMYGFFSLFMQRIITKTVQETAQQFYWACSEGLGIFIRGWYNLTYTFTQ